MPFFLKGEFMHPKITYLQNQLTEIKDKWIIDNYKGLAHIYWIYDENKSEIIYSVIMVQ